MYSNYHPSRQFSSTVKKDLWFNYRPSHTWNYPTQHQPVWFCKGLWYCWRNIRNSPENTAKSVPYDLSLPGKVVRPHLTSVNLVRIPWSRHSWTAYQLGSNARSKQQQPSKISGSQPMLSDQSINLLILELIYSLIISTSWKISLLSLKNIRTLIDSLI